MKIGAQEYKEFAAIAHYEVSRRSFFTPVDIILYGGALIADTDCSRSMNWPNTAPKSPDFTLTVNGETVFVHETNVAAFAILSFVGEAQIVVQTKTPIGAATVRPARRNRTAISSRTLWLRLDEPTKVSVEIDGLKPLFLFASAPETEIPDRNDPTVKYYSSGEIYDAGEIELLSGETLYIESGAIVRGTVRARNADHVKVLGRGILDGGVTNGAKRKGKRLALFECSRDLHVEGITMINPASWMLVLAACEGVVVRNINEIGEVVSSDGIDVVGSRDVLIEDCFLRNNDDCIVIKAVDFNLYKEIGEPAWGRGTHNVLARRCVLLNAEAGNALEIGYETRADTISGITFRDCDVIAAHGDGGVFTIHAGDRAAVSDVLYEDIRVEHFFDKLIDFRILFSRYSKDAERGQIRNVILRGIRTNLDPFNCISLIGGFDAAHTVEGVVIEDFMIGDQKITNPDQLHLFTKHASGIVFR